MPASTVPSVEILKLNVAPQEAVHPRRQRAFRREDREMVVVRHQRVVVQLPTRSLDLLCKEDHEPLPVLVIPEDVDAVVPTRHDVMERPLELGPRLPRHATQATSAAIAAARSRP